jgi:hypothetical protein
MSTGLDEILASSRAWLDDLPAYQSALVRSLLQSGLSEEEAAAVWLDGATKDLATFGSGGTSSLFYRKFIEELHAFLCSEERYGADRGELLKQFKAGQASAIGLMSAALSPHLGAVGALLAPAIALVLILIGKMGLNAWCAMVSEREASSSALDADGEDAQTVTARPTDED